MEKIKAYSKTNLSLRVFSKRGNEALHRIDSVFVLHKDLFDEIEIQDATRDEVLFTGMKVGKENTVSKSLAIFKKRFQVNGFYRIVVHKNIPIGSGLGGGSSDAGALLCWLAKKHAVSQNLILPLALQVGSDVPFFVAGHECARVSGFGGIVRPITCDWKVRKIITSEVLSLSKDVYEKFDSLDHSSRPKRSINGFLAGFYEPFNDLQPAFLALHSSFQAVIARLTKNSDVVLVSGSGSSLAILFKS